MVKIKCFADLKERFTEGMHYCRTSIDRSGDILVLAPHGGSIERGTSEIARAIAGEGWSLYLYESLLKTRYSKPLRLTSTKFDEPMCLELIGRFPKAIAIHGCNEEIPVIYIGGRDPEKERLVDELVAKGYPAKLGTGRLAGTSVKNICNRTSTGKGIQLEFSRGIRCSYFVNWKTREGRENTTQAMEQFVADFRSIIMDEGKDGHVPTNSSVG